MSGLEAGSQNWRERLILVGALLVVAGAMALPLVQNRQETIKMAEEEMRQIGNSLSNAMQRDMTTAVQILEEVNTAWSILKADPEGLVQTTWLLTSFERALNGVRTLVIMDKGAKILSSNQETLIGRSFPDREYFRAVRDDPDPKKLFIASPYVGALGVSIINLTKAIVDQEGKFDGVLVASLDPQEFRTLMVSMIHNPDLEMTLSHGSGKLWIQVPEPPADQAPAAPFAKEILAQLEAGPLLRVIQKDDPDHPDLLTLMVKIRPAQPSTSDSFLVLNLSWNLETILAAWNQRVYQAGIVVVLLSIFSLGILLAYQSRRTKTQNQVKAVEEALRVNQEELENFFNLSLDLLCITDQDGRFLKVNRAWESILGYGWQTLSSTRYLDFVHPDDLPETLAELEKLGQGEAVLKFINRYRTQAGDHRYIEWFLVPGGAGRVYAAARDITQARLNEDLLREKEARLRHILDKIRVGCLIVDQGGKEHYRNHQFDELFGATDDDFTRREGISGWWRQTALPSWPTQQDIPTAELVLPTKDGMARSLETGGIFLGDKLLLTFFDQTDRRAYEQKLEHAKLAAEEASQAKSNFLANMSHEIRTPMNAILGFTRLALEKNLPEEASGHIRKAYHSAKTLLGILNDVLDFSKIEAGKLDLEIEPVILQDFLRQTAELFEAELRQTGNSLEIKVAADIPPAILTDTLRLGQILRNLISNAVKFTSAGRITLQVQRPSMDGDIAGLEFTVEDTGLGMSPEQVERLFLPFVQGDSSITRRFGGTGLGLAICQKLVGLLGGRIEVSSTLGQGSRFCFLIRVQTIEAPQVRLIRDNAKAEKGDLKGMRILLAEDNALNQQVAQELLHSMGAEVHLAGDGTQAVKMAGQMVFDAILMDLHMPIMDGYEASRLILSQKLCGDAPIFALTAAVLPEDRSRCLAIGMRGFLAKPIEPEELIRALKGVRTNGSDQASRAAPPEKPSLPGPPLFNPESALARLGGNRELLLELLEAFRPQMEADLEKLQPLRDSGRTKNASDIIHGIKGYAGNLGCEGLHAASVELESRLKSGAADPPWEAFMRTADLTLTHIQEWKSGEEI